MDGLVGAFILLLVVIDRVVIDLWHGVGCMYVCIYAHVFVA